MARTKTVEEVKAEHIADLGPDLGLVHQELWN